MEQLSGRAKKSLGLSSDDLIPDERGDSTFKKRILYAINRVPYMAGTEVGALQECGPLELLIWHRAMERYGWISWHDWKRQPQVVMQGLYSIWNTIAENDERNRGV